MSTNNSPSHSTASASGNKRTRNFRDSPKEIYAGSMRLLVAGAWDYGVVDCWVVGFMSLGLIASGLN